MTTASLPPAGVPPHQDDALPALGMIVGQKYRLERLLGAGGMGAVFLAYHLQLARHVALKVLKPRALQAPELRARFYREAMATARLTSEHLVRVLDVGELEGGAPYLVMDYLSGDDLATVLRHRGPLPVEEVVDLLRQACAGLAEVHAAGIVHRDLKPANLLLVPRENGRPWLKIIDFGIAKAPVLASSTLSNVESPARAALSSLATETSVVMGSLHYMAPEQMESFRDVDPRADIWSLGVVAYRLLTGIYPFEGASHQELLRVIVQSQPPPVTRYRADVSPRLEAIVQRCLEPALDRRWPSVVELEAALAEVSMAPAATPKSVRTGPSRGRIALGIWLGGALLFAGSLGWVSLVAKPDQAVLSGPRGQQDASVSASVSAREPAQARPVEILTGVRQQAGKQEPSTDLENDEGKPAISPSQWSFFDGGSSPDNEEKSVSGSLPKPRSAPAPAPQPEPKPSPAPVPAPQPEPKPRSAPAPAPQPEPTFTKPAPRWYPGPLLAR